MAPGMEGMAPENPAHCQVESPEHAVALYRLSGVLTTGGLKAAMGP